MSTKSWTGLELYDIAQGGRLTNGRPLNEEQLKSFVEAASKTIRKRKKRSEQTIYGIVDERTLYVSAKSLMFVVPAGQKTVFVGDEKNFKPIPVFLPAMVFYYGLDGSLMAFWSKTDERSKLLAEERVLLPAPMPNISKDGDVCVGTSMKKKHGTDIRELQKFVTDSFMGSAFNEWRSSETTAAMSFATNTKATTGEEFWKLAKKEKWNRPKSYRCIADILP